MEFYFKDMLGDGKSIPFQFPTGWNSTKHIASSLGKKDGFNSQRDGILLRRLESGSKRNEFQFPTGWNST